MILFIHHTGPMMKFEGEFLYIEDLNPEIKTQWRMSRWEMFKLGWRCILCAILP